MNAKQFLEAGASHIGEQYIFGAIVPMNNPNWHGPWDCAEFVTYIVHSITDVLYGTRNRDSYTGYWYEDAINKKVTTIPFMEAVRTEGAILLRKPVENRIGHIAFSDGKGNTLEARGKAFGVCRYVALSSDGSNTREWNIGIKIPGVEYVSEIAQLIPLENVMPLNLSANRVREIQDSLQKKGLLYKHGIGKDDQSTKEAIFNFQLANDLEPSGLLDHETIKLLV